MSKTAKQAFPHPTRVIRQQQMTATDFIKHMDRFGISQTAASPLGPQNAAQGGYTHGAC